MKAHATAAHEPVREGVFHDRAIHEKDRQAKFGDTRRSRNSSTPTSFPSKGLIPEDQMTLIKVLSEVSNGPWASAAEIGIIGDKIR